MMMSAMAGLISGRRAVFRPTDIDGCQLWLDANQITGLSDGDAVGTWSDKSGQENDATQSDASYKPTYKTNIVNSKPVVRFDGGDLLATTSVVSALSSSATIFAVVKNPSTASGDDIFLGHSTAASTANNYLWIGIRNTTGYAAMDMNGGNTKVNGDTDLRDDVFHIHTGIKGSDNTISRYGIDGGTYGTNSTSFTLSANVTNIGGLTYNSAAVSMIAGDIAEVIIYNSALSDGDRGDVETYLSQKYNISI
jgi:hypothetical protein